MECRIEKDTMGIVRVPVDAYYGAQTQRSIENFEIAQDINRMPKEIIYAFAYLKKGAALANKDAGVLSAEKCDLIVRVCDEILAGRLDEAFPLVVWQTGSGTQTNMNVNEVIANRAHVLVPPSASSARCGNVFFIDWMPYSSWAAYPLNSCPKVKGVASIK